MITVAVDTTATFVDVMMRKTPWMKLLTLCQAAEIDLVLPDVVLRETARHWEAEALKTIEQANGKLVGIAKSREKLTEFGIDASGLAESAPVTETPNRAKFTQLTRDKLESLGVIVRPVPDHVDIETVLERDLDRRKPFSSIGKGFRDTLIWETVKAVVLASKPGDTIFFITNNTGDYCGAAGTFAPELLAEVEAASGELIQMASLEDLLQHPDLAPKVATLTQSDEQLTAFLELALSANSTDAEPPSMDQIVKGAVLRALERLANEEVETENVATSGLDFTDLDIPSELEGLTIDVVEPDESSLTWQTYETYDDSTLLIQAEVEADISLDGFVYKSDAYSLTENGKIQVLDWDWNRHMAHVVTSTQARLTFRVRLEKGTDSAEECEFEGAQRVNEDDPHSLS
jgi:hypothetical protein